MKVKIVKTNNKYILSVYDPKNEAYVEVEAWFSDSGIIQFNPDIEIEQEEEQICIEHLLEMKAMKTDLKIDWEEIQIWLKTIPTVESSVMEEENVWFEDVTEETLGEEE